MANKTEPNKTPYPAKNYLTLIIVLIVLLCVSMSAAMAFAAPSLDGSQKWFLVVSLITFAFFSTGIVAWLVLRHSNKLTVSENDDVLLWETISDEKQKRKLNNEVRELAAHLEIPTEQLSDLRSAYIVAEDLALRKIQADASSPLMRKISVGNADFDAIGIEDDLITFIEVTFVVTSDLTKEKIKSYLRKVSSAQSILAKQREGSRIRFLLVIVTQIDRESMDELRPKVRNNIKNEMIPNISVDVRFLDFLSLQKIYAED